MAETTPSEPLPVVTASLLCLDFWSRRSDYENQIIPFLKKNRTVLQLDHAEDVLEAYIEKVWPHDLPGSMITAHASFDDYDRYIFRPPVDGPLADGFAADGRVPLFGAYRKQGTLVIDRCILTTPLPPRPFERYVSGQIFTVMNGQRMQQTDFDALAQLPRIHDKVRQHLQLWLECLDWQEKLTFIRQQDLRYEKVMVGDDGRILFLVQDQQARRKLQQKRSLFMMVASLTDSQSPDSWQPVEGVRVSLQRIGLLEKIQWIDPDKLPFEVDHGQGLPDRKSAMVVIRPEGGLLPEDIPEEGFLLTSVGGDLKPIHSMRQAIQRFMKGQGHNWFLPYWLFDIHNAAAPGQTQAIYRDEQPGAPLNRQQKAAVQKALATIDVMLILGPPGTGKTATIAEICSRQCRQGNRVLLVSQANTAVDNALSQLMQDSYIRPLRYGNPDRLEPEAQCFLQENVLQGWLGSLRESCAQRTQQNRQLSLKLQQAQEALGQLTSLEQQAARASGQMETCQSRLQELRRSQESLAQEANVVQERIDLGERRRQALKALKDWISGHDNRPGSMELVGDETLSQQVDQLVLDIQKVLAIQSKLSVPGWTEPCRNSWSFLQSLRQALDHLGPIERLADTMIGLCQRPHSASDDAWGQLCRQLQLALIGAFETASVSPLEELIASLHPSSQGLERLSELKTFCQIAAGPIRQLLRRGCEQIGNHIGVLLAENEAAYARDHQQLQDSLTEKDRMDTTQIAAAEELAAWGQQLEECRQKWRQVWPTACADQDTPESAPSIAQTALQQRRQQLQEWLEETEPRIQRQQQWEVIRQKWQSILTQPAAAGNAQLLEMYVSLANVVGATCLETGQRSFYGSKEFQPFEVVIVDEVSKATPIELLMAMMLGQRVILVGDHRQLPPMHKERENSYTEALAEGAIQPEDFQRFQELITSSYFEQLYTRAPASIKQWLGIQYRSHNDIMSIDNPFYNGRLSCPEDVEAFNRTKQHHLTLYDRFGGKYLEPHQHVLWVDSSKAPNGRPFFEKQLGSSKVNLLEVSLVMANLELLNQAVRQRGYQAPLTAQVSAYENGLPLKEWLKQKLSHACPETLAEILKRGKFQVNSRTATAETLLKKRDKVSVDTRMPVGVITFYGAQLGRIRQSIKQLRGPRADALDCLDIKTNTVDKFQGMEVPLVIVSMVRAPRHNHLGQFVKEYRRINVALSRAQKLLIIIGAAATFRPAMIDLPEMDSGEIKEIAVYEIIYQLITQKGGRRYARQLINRFEPRLAENHHRLAV